MKFTFLGGLQNFKQTKNPTSTRKQKQKPEITKKKKYKIQKKKEIKK